MTPASLTEPPERILVRAPNWLGDVVMSTPGFRALRGAYPGARIVGLLPASLAPLLAGSPDFDAIWTFESKGFAAMRETARRISREDFDLGIVIPESISSALMMRWGGVRRVTGYARDKLRRALLSDVVDAPPEWGRRRWVSKERFVLGLMAAAGAPSSDTRLRLDVTASEEARLDHLIKKIGLDSQTLLASPPIVVAPGASYGESKCWPVSAFAAFADRMVDRGEQVVFVGTAAESDRIRSVKRSMRNVAIDTGGLLDLGMLKAMLRRAKLLVANDAGSRHIASAFEIPSVIFFGPTSVAKTDENLSGIEVLETEHECRPCYRRRCPIDHRCLTTISVDEAVAAADRALAAPGSRSIPAASGGMRA
jgi:lipopolysaccharide heptosyltransferase II